MSSLPPVASRMFRILSRRELVFELSCEGRTPQDGGQGRRYADREQGATRHPTMANI